MRALAGAHDVVAVITQPARPRGRGQRTQPTAVAEAGRELKLDVWEPQRPRDVVDGLRALGADLYVVASYGKILPQSVLDVPPRGAFNVHPSLLPLYRGASPLQAQIRDGCTTTGVTIMAMDAGMDTGDVLLQERTPLGARETYGELEARLADLGARVLLDAIAGEERGTLQRIPQRELAPERDIEATLTRPLTTKDLNIDWHRSATAVDAFVRSLSPQPAARTVLSGTPCKILAVHPVTGEAAGEPGTLRPAGRGVAVACAGGAVVLDRLIPANRNAMSGEAFAASLQLR